MYLKQTAISCVFFLLVLTTSACGSAPPPAEPLVTPPAITVQISKEYCPSIEAQTGMQVAWTNVDDVDRILMIELVDDQGAIIDSGGTDLLQPGATFSTTLTTPGQYTVYCSKDHVSFGLMNVTP